MEERVGPKELATLDETGLREAKVEWPKTEEELLAIIRALRDRQHTYGTVVYAMSIAAEAAFNYMASDQGTTGFQASCADLDFIRRTRNIRGPFSLFKAEDLCYPQYDLNEKFREWTAKSADWVAEECRAKLLDTCSAHPNVIAHWRKKANG